MHVGTGSNPGRGRGWRVGMVAGVLLALALAGCAEGGSPQVGTSELVTEEEPLVRMHEGPSVLLDADDPDTAYLADVDLANGTCEFAVSTDGGDTWEERPAPELEPFTDCGYGAANPKNIRTQLDQGPDGTLFSVFHAQDPDAGGSRSVLLGRSSDQGQSWDTSLVYSPGDAREGEDIEVNFVPHVAVDPDDPERVVVVWRRSFQAAGEEDAPPSRPFLAWSDDGGETFGEPFMMLDEDLGFEAPKLRIVDGRLFAFYRLRPEGDGVDNEVVAAVSDDDGETWEPTTIASAGDVSEPVVAHDPQAGVFHLVWHDNSNEELDAFYASSSDGLTWSEPVRLNDDAEGNRIGQFYPVVAVAPDGRVDAAWYDYRDDPYPAPTPPEDGELNLFNNMGQHQSVYATSSMDGGQTWLPNLQVSDVRIDRTFGPWDLNFFTQVPPAIASGPDGALVAWSDTRLGDATTGTQDIAAARLTFDGGSNRVPLAMLTGLSGVLLGAGLATVIGAVALRRRTGGSAPGGSRSTTD
ncbi:MAG: sialidase family protein [Egibacteraceae bacterium]